MKRPVRNSVASILTLPASLTLALLLASVLVTSVLAQSTPSSSAAPSADAPVSDASGPVSPNYELAARFVPTRVGKLVFDTSVTPHWFELSDRFWYSYETSDGVRYWLVDPAKKLKMSLFDNAKLAASLSTLTNYPYDAQHLPIRNLKLVKHDTALQFEVEISKEGVIPNEPKKEKSDEETIQEDTEHKQVQQTVERGRGEQQAEQASAEAPPTTRTLYFEYDLATGKVTRLDNFEPTPKKPLWASISPDEKTIVFARGFNLYMMDAQNYAKAQKKPGDTSVVESQLTTDGEDRYRYSRRIVQEELELLKKYQKGETNKAGPRVPPIPIYWSKDSKKFAVVRADERKILDYWVVHTLANLRPTLESYPYALPGEANVPQYEIQIFDIASKQRLLIQTAAFKDQTLTIATDRVTARQREHEQQITERIREGVFIPPTPGYWLSDTSDKLYFLRSSRDLHRIDVCVADTSTGVSKPLIEERSNVFIDVLPLRQLNNGQELLWWSERDGWGHYYLYSGDGILKIQVTSGEYMASQILSLDEKSRVFYFLANGREPGEDPYYEHLYRVNLDGSGLKLLTPGDFSHVLSAADSGKYFLDTFSRVDAAPKSVLLDDAGIQLADLETTDVKRLLQAGFKYPETFRAKADDGITDIYGVMYKPFDFNPSRKYPLIEYVYPGPQTESVTKTFSPKNIDVPLAQLGFIVIELGNRGGSPQRDKWYDSFGYGNLRDYGLADKKVVAEQLAALHPYIDISRVGIWGHSGGGFMTAAAMLQYPDFFKVGWSESGNHENNVYNKFWSEKYHGVKEETQKDGTVKFIYNIERNSQLAKNLKGHLMLTTGDMDNNVHMANTMRLADALLKANKRFDMLVFPGIRHGYMSIQEYVFWRRADYFSRWLLGSSETSADILELQRDRLASPAPPPNAARRSSP